MVSTRKKNKNKKQLNLVDESSNAYILGNITNADTVEKETVEPHTGVRASNFGRPVQVTIE